MDCKDRIYLITVLDKIERNKAFAERLGLKVECSMRKDGEKSTITGKA